MPAKTKKKQKDSSVPLELIADPVEQIANARKPQIEEALEKVQDLLIRDGEAHAPDVQESPNLFNALRYSAPFRHLIGLAAE